MACIRCGREEKLENHHIKQRRDGGGDEPENKEERCAACHDYEHARRNILESIQEWQGKLDRAYKASRRLAIMARLELLKHRLVVLDSLNSPDQIRIKGEYISYWVDETTHNVTPIPQEPENLNAKITEQSRLFND